MHGPPLADYINRMTPPAKSNEPGYEQPYANFEAPLMRQLRKEAYGEDIGQHSWVTAAELRSDIVRLALGPSSHVLDLGCGPGGPLTFMMQASGCSGTGIDLSAAALDAASQRATALGVAARLSVRVADLNEPLPFADAGFDVVVSLDAILHARDRRGAYREVARLLVPGGAFLFTDAGVITGAISNAEVAARSVHGFTQLCPPGFNERLLAECGLQVTCQEDRTASLYSNAAGRLAARATYSAELEKLEGAEHFARQQQYLGTVVELSRRGALSRIMYLAKAATAKR